MKWLALLAGIVLLGLSAASGGSAIFNLIGWGCILVFVVRSLSGKRPEKTNAPVGWTPPDKR